MIIRASNKKEAWEKATAIFGDTLVLQSVESEYKTFTPDRDGGLVSGYVNEYDDELELIFSSGDSMEIMFPKEESIDDLKHQVAELEEANRVLLKDNSELKAKALKYRKIEEQNKTLIQMLKTYSKVSGDVSQYIDAVAEFREFFGKVSQLQKTLEALEGDEK